MKFITTNFVVVFLCLVSQSSFAYIYCQTKVSSIHAHKDNGIVYFKFTDGTAIEGNETQSGLQ